MTCSFTANSRFLLNRYTPLLQPTPARLLHSLTPCPPVWEILDLPLPMSNSSELCFILQHVLVSNCLIYYFLVIMYQNMNAYSIKKKCKLRYLQMCTIHSYYAYSTYILCIAHSCYSQVPFFWHS